MTAKNQSNSGLRWIVLTAAFQRVMNFDLWEVSDGTVRQVA